MSYYRYSGSSYYRPSLFGGFKFFPPVIKALLIGNVAVYLLLNFFGMFRFRGFPLGEVINALLPLYPLGDGFQVWQLFTYMFMHANLMHLLINMFALWMFGMELENDWGSRKFLIYYMICGLGAGLSNLLIGPLFGPAGPTVGASGAIYGVLVAFGITYPDRPIFIYFLLPIRAKYFVLIYIIVEILTVGSSDGIAHFAHLGGAAVGLIYLFAVGKSLPFSRIFKRAGERLRLHEPRGPGAGGYSGREEISDAEYHDIGDEEHGVNQKRIDEILDKISQNGYQSLSEEEKKILFEASKKLN